LAPASARTSTPTVFSGFGAPLLSANGFYYGSGGCTPTQVKVAIEAGTPQTVRVVVFFFKLSDEASGKSGSWSEASR